MLPPLVCSNDCSFLMFISLLCHMCACASVEHQFQVASARVLFLISYQVHLVLVVLSTASVVVRGDVETDKQR